MEITTYSQALKFLYHSIPQGSLRFPGSKGLERQALLLKLLGNPQNTYPVIHLAGTSGKGSTATFLSHLLVSHGFKVGLTVSPHILDIRERIQINNQNISQSDFIDLLNQIIPAIAEVEKLGWGRATYFEIIVTMFYLAFAKNKVDYAVVETGMGGLMDGTNVITRPDKIALITRLGLDHTSVLGKTLSQIAFQKAGIIHPGNTIISPWQSISARQVLQTTADGKHSDIYFVKKNQNYKNIQPCRHGLCFDFIFHSLKLSQLFLNSKAVYQVENCSLALATLSLLSERDNFLLNQSTIIQTLANFNFLGRMDIQFQNGSTVVFDGAHNPQKMTAFLNSLKFNFPSQKFIFVIAFKQKKEARSMVRKIIPLAEKIILTGFVVKDQDMSAISQDTDYLVKILNQFHYSSYQIDTNPQSAIAKAVSQSKYVAVTGSLYLLGKIYRQK